MSIAAYELDDAIVEHLGRFPVTAGDLHRRVLDSLGGDLPVRRLFRALARLIAAGRVVRCTEHPVKPARYMRGVAADQPSPVERERDQRVLALADDYRDAIQTVAELWSDHAEAAPVARRAAALDYMRAHDRAQVAKQRLLEHLETPL